LVFQACPICIVWREPIKRGMWPLGVVECYPILDDASGLEPVSDFFEIDRLLFQGAPQPLDKDVVEVTTPKTLALS